VQLIASNLLFENDTNLVSLRFHDGNVSQRTTLSFDTRYSAPHQIRVNPRFRIDHREDVNSDTVQWIYRPSMRILYRLNRKNNFEIEFGAEWASREIDETLEEDTLGYFGALGYRYDF
ncbi:MAG: hypothetical protein ACR2PS_14645, partial [Pseudomonadales bacterium]